MRGALQQGQPVCLVTPSHPNVAGWRSLRHRPAMPRNFRVPPSCAPPQSIFLSLICPRSPGTEVCPKARPTCSGGGPSSDHPGVRAQGAREGSPIPSPPSGSAEKCVLGLLSGWETGKTPSLLLPHTHLGIIKSAMGKRRTAGATVLLGPNTDSSASRARVLCRGGWLQNMETKFSASRVRAVQQSWPGSWADVNSFGLSDTLPEGVEDKTRCGLSGLSPAPPSPSTTSPPALRERGRQGGGRSAERLPPPSFVAVRIPMLLFLTGHWWLYRQVLRRGCNYPG